MDFRWGKAVPLFDIPVYDKYRASVLCTYMQYLFKFVTTASFCLTGPRHLGFGGEKTRKMHACNVGAYRWRSLSPGPGHQYLFCPKLRHILFLAAQCPQLLSKARHVVNHPETRHHKSCHKLHIRRPVGQSASWPTLPPRSPCFVDFITQGNLLSSPLSRVSFDLDG